MKRTLQIDVLGEAEESTSLIKCNIYIDGRCCEFYTFKHNYEELIRDGVFIRDGKSKDSAGVLNTTHVFEENKDYFKED